MPRGWMLCCCICFLVAAAGAAKPTAATATPAPAAAVGSSGAINFEGPQQSAAVAAASQAAAATAVAPTRHLQQAALSCSTGFHLCGARCVHNSSPKLCSGRCVTGPKPCSNATRCTPCTAIANGRAICSKAATPSRTCSLVCNAGFALRNITAGKAAKCAKLLAPPPPRLSPSPPPPPPPPLSPPPPPPAPSPPPPPAITVSEIFFGLRPTEDGTRVTRQQQLQQYGQLAAAGARVMAVLSGPAAPSRTDLVRAACSSSTALCGIYGDVLLTMLLPATYSSNSTEDTDGFSHISPAQDQQTCAACVGFAGTAAAEAALNVALRRNYAATSLSEQDLSFCRMKSKISCSTGSSYRDLLDSVERLSQLTSREASPYLDSSFGVNCNTQSMVPAPDPVFIGCFEEPGNCGGVNERPLMFLQKAPAGMTVQACVNLARLRGFKYAALQSGNECYGGNDISKYTTPGTCSKRCDGNPGQVCGDACTNSVYQLKPDGGKFRQAQNGNALESMARIKRQIILSGGVLASMVIYSDLTSTYRPGPDTVYNTTGSSRQAADGSLADLHALFCFGWDDIWQAWLCKNSWGADWGLPGGAFRVAYGAAFIMQPDYTFGIEFMLDGSGRRALEQLRSSSAPDAAQAGCWLYSPPRPTRLLQLVRLLDLAQAELDEKDLTNARPSTLQIIEDLLLANAAAGGGSPGTDQTGMGQSTAQALTGLRGIGSATSSQQPFRICGSTAAGVLNPPAGQLDALLAFKNAVDPNAFVLKDWTRSAGAAGGFCKWQGVTCDTEGNVAQLALIQRALGGALPHSSAWLGLPSLTQAWLQSCALAGSLPSQLYELPRLQMVYLSQNNITSTLPAEWAGWGHLKELQLWENSLSGQLPPSWGPGMTALEQLGLGSSPMLGGSIPESWSGMISLQRMSISRCPLSGSIPAALPPNLKVLALGGNRLSGSIGSSVTQLSQLEELYLWSNALTGPLPEALGDLSNIVVLVVASNKLSGPVTMLSRANKLQHLDLSSNMFDLGPLPPAGNAWPAGIMILALENSKFTGTIPDSYGQLPNLEELYLSDNQLSGKLPDSLATLSKLQLLWVHRNLLTGTLPSSYGAGMPALTELLTFGNQGLTGCIPKEFEGRVNQPDSGYDMTYITYDTAISGFCSSINSSSSSSGSLPHPAEAGTVSVTAASSISSQKSIHRIASDGLLDNVLPGNSARPRLREQAPVEGR